jgi:leader peptidase (prepilin peptidase)/N-methyltransferase
MSVVSPPSHCPACGEPIPFYRNVPLLSYLLLRGKAGCCGAPIPGRYFLVELLSGALGAAVVERVMLGAEPGTTLLQAGAEALITFFFVGGLVIATFVDLEWMEIPDEISIGGTAFALATVGLRSEVDLSSVVLGAGGSYLLVLLLLTYTWERIFGRRGMGEGDAKLMMFIGAFLGWEGAAFALVAGAVQGTLLALISRITGKALVADPPLTEEEEAADTALTRMGMLLPPQPWPGDKEEEAPRFLGRQLPFGPFLALAALQYLFFGPQIVELYLSLVERFL